MDKRPAANTEALQSGFARQNFVLAGCARRVPRDAFQVEALARAVRRSADPGVDEEILSWIASHVSPDRQRKEPAA